MLNVFFMFWNIFFDNIFQFTPCEISVEGKKMAIKTDDSRLFWTPAPPRLDVPPAKVREKLFPLYEGNPIDEESEVTQEEVESSEDSEDEEPENMYYVNPEDLANRDRSVFNTVHGGVCVILCFIG